MKNLAKILPFMMIGAMSSRPQIKGVFVGRQVPIYEPPCQMKFSVCCACHHIDRDAMNHTCFKQARKKGKIRGKAGTKCANFTKNYKPT